MKFPYYSTFSSVLKPIVSEEKDKYLALASLEEVKALLPNIDTKANHDILPIAFNACVVNRVNKNDDAIDTQTAIATYKNFIYKQINLEHNRKNLVGVILTAGFSEFGTDKPLTEEEASKLTGPFNIVLGGVVWKIVNPGLAENIEEASDPTSEKYLSISASWELGFTGYRVVILPKGQKNIEDGQMISEASEVEKLKELLKAVGGSGETEDGRRVYRVPTKELLPIGIGLTERPAAEVKGIATAGEKTEEHTEASEHYINKCSCGTILSQCRCSGNKKESIIENGCDVCKNNISQAQNSNVNIERNNSNMKITSIKDITDESLKTATASTIAEVIQHELTEKAKTWDSEKTQLNTQLTKAAEDAKKLNEEQVTLKETVKTLQASIEALQKEKEERVKVEKFNERMTKVNDAYQLDDEVRAAIVEEVKAIASDEDFAKWEKKASVLLKGFAKQAKTTTDTTQTSASTNQVIDKALDAADKDKNIIPNTTSSTQPTLKEKYQAAFAKEMFDIKY